jgi:hypothetical protein
LTLGLENRNIALISDDVIYMKNILLFVFCYKYYIYHGSYELTYLNQGIQRMSWFK